MVVNLGYFTNLVCNHKRFEIDCVLELICISELFTPMLNFFKRKERKDSLAKTDTNRRRASFHALTVSDIRRETADCVSVAFDVPKTLKEDYSFIQGQYLTLRNRINGEEIRRSYSICSSPLDGELRVAIKKVPDGVFSTYANEELKKGEQLEVMTPEGNFFRPLNADHSHLYVAFASGSGITPLLSIIRTTLEVESTSRFTLFYGNRNNSSVIFKEQLEDLKNEFMGRLEIHYILSREDQGTDWLKGRIDGEKCRHFAKSFFEPQKVNTFFLCGPVGMIEEVSATLTDLGVDKKNILFELFTTVGGKQKDITQGAPLKAKGIVSRVTVVLDTEETHFEIDANGKSILDAALDAGADVPFACKGAVCCTCRAKVLEGEVEMDMNYALEEEEVEEGYVLTCQSHPRSERVVISYDE